MYRLLSRMLDLSYAHLRLSRNCPISPLPPPAGCRLLHDYLVSFVVIPWYSLKWSLQPLLGSGSLKKSHLLSQLVPYKCSMARSLPIKKRRSGIFSIFDPCHRLPFFHWNIDEFSLRVYPLPLSQAIIGFTEGWKGSGSDGR